MNRKAVIGSITIEEHPATSTGYYLWLNPSETFSKLSIRQSDSDKQGDHGIEESLAYYGARMLPFEILIFAASRAALVTMEQALRQEFSLAAAQDFDGEDGYKLVLLTDEDEVEKQIYARVMEPPTFEMLQDLGQRRRRCSFVMRSGNPVIYSQELDEETIPESYNTTNATIKDGALPTIKDGALPTIKDDIGSQMTLNVGGTFGTAPVFTIPGPTVNPVVHNLTTEKQMEFSANGGVGLLEDETLTIDVVAKTITKTDVDGVETDESGTLTEDSEWIYLTPGENTLVIFDDSSDELEGQLEVSWRDSWI